MANNEVVNVAEYEELARQKLPKMVYDYYASGAEDQWTLKENRSAFERIRCGGHSRTHVFGASLLLLHHSSSGSCCSSIHKPTRPVHLHPKTNKIRNLVFSHSRASESLPINLSGGRSRLNLDRHAQHTKTTHPSQPQDDNLPSIRPLKTPTHHLRYGNGENMDKIGRDSSVFKSNRLYILISSGFSL